LFFGFLGATAAGGFAIAVALPDNWGRASELLTAMIFCFAAWMVVRMRAEIVDSSTVGQLVDTSAVDQDACDAAKDGAGEIRHLTLLFIR
jgi:hypothetical protein